MSRQQYVPVSNPNSLKIGDFCKILWTYKNGSSERLDAKVIDANRMQRKVRVKFVDDDHKTWYGYQQIKLVFTVPRKQGRSVQNKQKSSSKWTSWIPGMGGNDTYSNESSFGNSNMNSNRNGYSNGYANGSGYGQRKMQKQKQMSQLEQIQRTELLLKQTRNCLDSIEAYGNAYLEFKSNPSPETKENLQLKDWMSSSQLSLMRMSLSEVREKNDTKALKLAGNVLVKFEKKIEKEKKKYGSTFKKKIQPKMETLERVFQGKEIANIPPPNYKKEDDFNEDTVEQGLGHFLKGKHSVLDTENRVKENQEKYKKKHDEMLKEDEMEENFKKLQNKDSTYYSAQDLIQDVDQKLVRKDFYKGSEKKKSDGFHTRTNSDGKPDLFSGAGGQCNDNRTFNTEQGDGCCGHGHSGSSHSGRVTHDSEVDEDGDTNMNMDKRHKQKPKQQRQQQQQRTSNGSSRSSNGYSTRSNYSRRV